MSKARYSVRRVTNTPAHSVHSVQCINDFGVAIALASTASGNDYGFAVCRQRTSARDWITETVHKLAEPTICAINDSGQFAGWCLKSGREHALLGRLAPTPNYSVSREVSGATSLHANGDVVGFRQQTDGLSGFAQTGDTITRLEAPSTSGDYLASWISKDGMVAGRCLRSPHVLVWDATSKLVAEIESNVGELIARSDDGNILCAYGAITPHEQLWFASPRGGVDFVACAANTVGDVVGRGRALEPGLGTLACLWRNGESFNLNDLVEAPSLHLREATAISNGGWIACTDADGEPILLEPATP